MFSKKKDSQLACFYNRFPILPKSHSVGVFVSLGVSRQEKSWPKTDFDHCIKMCNLPIETDDTDTKSVLIPVFHTTSTFFTQ